MEGMKEVQIKIGKRTLYNVSWKQLLYILCFFFLCVIDQRVLTAHPNDGTRETFRNLTGVCMAAFILSHYTWKDIVKYKVYYLGWSILAVTGLPFLFMMGRSWLPFLNMWITVILLIFIWGYVLLATGISFFIEKRRPRLQKKTFAVWFVMMFLMIVSRSNLIWPECYLVMFGCFYLTDFSETERKFLLEGALSGIISAFIVFQGLSFLYRPYDALRYNGWYTNCNNNALFYLIVLAAVLTKLYDVKNRQGSRWQQLCYLLAAGAVLSFLFMTIGRAAWITAFFMVIFLLCFLYGDKGKRAWCRNGLILVLCVCITFPLCFAAARYIPPLRHHPVWFFGEWSEDKVHAWDPWDSEKYVEADELFIAAFSRITSSVESVIEHLFPALKASAAEAVQTEARPALLDMEQRYDPIAIRGGIYRHFWSNLNWRGHTTDEIGVQLFSDYWVGHAHNIFLQFGTDFGIPVMILFAVMTIWPLVICKKRLRTENHTGYFGSFMWLFILPAFGMFEYAWGIGTMSIFMLFFAWGDVFWEEKY